MTRNNYHKNYMRQKRLVEKPLRLIEQIEKRFKKLDGHYRAVCLRRLRAVGANLSNF